MKLFSYGNIFFQIIQIKIGRFFTRIYIIYVNENLGKFFKDNKWNKQKGEEMFLETKSVFTKIQNSLPKNMKCRIFLKHTSLPYLLGIFHSFSFSKLAYVVYIQPSIIELFVVSSELKVVFAASYLFVYSLHLTLQVFLIFLCI